MNELANGIGWTVIVGVALYGVHIWLGHLLHERQRPERIWDHERRLALRKIYRATIDESVHNKVKAADGAWSLCQFPIDDQEYAARMVEQETAAEFRQAVENTRLLGDAYILQDNRLVFRKNVRA